MDTLPDPSKVVITSPQTPLYNCIAWAANDPLRWWWPDEMEISYWPPDVPREETLDAFIAAFTGLGYAREIHGEAVERYVSRVALFAAPDGVPTHACYQLPNGRWSSKLGSGVDVEHDLRDVECSTYGRLVVILERDDSKKIVLA